jgi:hypothetical protein
MPTQSPAVRIVARMNTMSFDTLAAAKRIEAAGL